MSRKEQPLWASLPSLFSREDPPSIPALFSRKAMSNTLKSKLVDLAAFGGLPTFEMPLHVGHPNLGDRARLMNRINHALDRGWLTNNGPYVQELEHKIAD